MQAVRAAEGSGPLQAAQLWSTLRRLSGVSRPPLYCAVAWSGGLDSTVLLHLMLAVRRNHPAQLRLRALHVDHHLQAASAQFRAHCVRLARQWRVPLAVLDADVKLGRGVSVEEAARVARQACWRPTLRPGELLLLAQHADDQVETALLALLRGAGPAGLAAMPEAAVLGQGQLLRPLLSQPRAALLDYAQRHALAHVEDPTNQDLRFDRNFLRAEVVPQLRRRWPGAVSTIPRSARHCANAAAVLAEQAAADLAVASAGADLEMAVLRRWPATRVNAVLRAWLARGSLRSPETRHLEQMRGMLALRPDAQPALVLPEFTVRAHAGRLICQIREVTADRNPAEPLWSWRRGVLRLPDGSQLAVRPEPHGDLDLASLPARLQVRFARGASQPRGRRLRKLLQELQVPQWERERLPLLSNPRGGVDDLLAVGDLWLHESIRSHTHTSRRGRIVWQMPS